MEKPNECTESNTRSSSAPVEILTEFLTCIMLKDYETALGLCTKILAHEPKNPTAKEFYPLILKKLEMIKNGELDNLSDSDDSTYSTSDSGSSHHDIDDMKSSPSSSNLSPNDADDKQSLDLKTSAFRSLNFFTKQTQQADVKKRVILSSTSQIQENNLKTLSKKKIHKPSYPYAWALSNLDQLSNTRTIKGDKNQNWIP